MSKSDFTHSIETHNGHQCIVIQDLNLGNMSVTNNIESVVADIAIMEKVDPDQHIIVYMDSEQIYDGWDPINGSFIPLQEEAWQEAASKMILLLSGIIQ